MANQTTPAIQVKDSNVGIGTNNPTAKLFIEGNDITLNTEGSAQGKQLYFRYSNGANIQSDSYLYFSTGGSPTEKMRITDGGNVGIGTTNPSTGKVVISQTGGTQLHLISGDSSGSTDVLLKMTSSIDYRGRGIWMNNSDTSGAWFAGVPYTGGSYSIGYSTTQPEYLANSKFFINTSGNVGIGTTAPTAGYKLDVVGSILSQVASGNTSIVVSTNNANGAMNAIAGSGLEIATDGTNQNIGFRTGVSTRMYIKSDGNVGIGTTSPSCKLTVDSSAGFSWGFPSTAAAKIGTPGTGGSLLVMTPSLNASYESGLAVDGTYSSGKTVVNINAFGVYSGGPYSADMVFKTSTNTTLSEKMRITNDGNVGIGTTAPGQKLQVDGSLLVNTGTSAAAYRDIMMGGIGGWATGESHGIDTVYGTAANPSTFSRIESHFDGTSGKIRFRNLFNNSAPSSAILMTIQGNGNVGIGTDGPAYTLDVQANTTSEPYVQARFLNTNSSGTEYGGILVNGTNQAHIRFLTGTSTWGGAGAKQWQIRAGFGSNIDALSIYSWTAGAEVIYFNSSGNVGIGTTSPSYKLHVNTSGSAENVIGVTNGTQTLTLGVNNASGGSFLFENSASALRFGTSNTEKMRITSAGNVGIGTTAPNSKLEVAGGIASTFGSTNGYVALQAGGSTVQGYIEWFKPNPTRVAYMGYNDGVSANNLGLTLENSANFVINGGNVGIGTTSPSYKLDVSGSARVNSTSNLAMFVKTNSAFGAAISYEDSTTGGNDVISAGAIGGDFYISTNYSERVRVTSAGNVGIGTTSPAKKLHVYNSGPNQGLRVSNADGVNMDVLSGANGGIVGTYSNHPLSLYTNSTEKVTITAAGNVGIGTTSPVAALHVQSSATKLFLSNTDFNTSTSTGSGLILHTGASSGNTYGQIYAFQSGNTSYANLVVPGGNVGIGTTAPASKLHIYQSNSEGIYLDGLQEYTTFKMLYGGNQKAEVVYQYSADQMYFNKFGTGTFAFYGGNVGIGASSPTEQLHVGGNVIVTYNNSYQGINSVGNKAILARVSPTTGIINYAEYATAANLNGFVMGSDDARVKGNIATDSLEFITNGSTQVTVLSNGNVGIANTNPSEKLSVTGNIRMDNGTADGPQLVLGSSGFSDWNIDNYSGSLRAYYGSTEYTRLTSSGNFGIGVSPSYKLDVAGDTRITSGSLGVGVVPNATDGRIDASNDIVAYSSSDRRLKENITPIANALDKVKSLTGVEFDWKPEHKKAHGYEGHDTGVIAQEVQEVMPTAVRTNDTGYLAVRYEKLIGLLIEANKELAARVEELENKLK